MSCRRESTFVLEFGVFWHLDADDCVHVVGCTVDVALQRASVDPITGTSCSTESVCSEFFARQCCTWLMEHHRNKLREVAERLVNK